MDSAADWPSLFGGTRSVAANDFEPDDKWDRSHEFG
jgi:hypothetical protein